jgi:hypothetical protein
MSDTTFHNEVRCKVLVHQLESSTIRVTRRAYPYDRNKASLKTQRLTVESSSQGNIRPIDDVAQTEKTVFLL